MMRLIQLAVLVLTVAWGPADAARPEYGKFVGDVKVVWNADHRTMTLLSDFKYIDPLNVTWDAPRGSTIDGASIPKLAWSLIGGPFEGPYRKASVIHDVACQRKTRPWESVHLAFYFAMKAEGSGDLQAKLMYAAVQHGGPRWPMTLHAERGTAGFDYQVVTLTNSAEAGFRSGSRIHLEYMLRGDKRAISSATPDDVMRLTKDPDVGFLRATIIPEPPPITEKNWPGLKAYVEKYNPSLEEIKAYKP
jgi:hypothetical protein